ncbi:Fur family zinc uptake regulator [Salana multivorans]|uniref:Fur family zinc uptake regulator n=1 Tax=Salana multivorans TaxID=120377 RepID=A0A3N2D0F0_9MICO|nr:transcriptional repressor [Salana multivorans]OJX94662.1 MAG: transcriptional repressor [Micrococcales bacterium 73-15]ROR93246.1 Fur family zinc uptake regulator [Salana multivorans]
MPDLSGHAVGQPQRMTTQRRAIAEVLGSVEDFRSAQQLHELLRSTGKRIGLATVYRALAGMAETGEIDAIRGPDGETRYRRCELRVHHHHLVCRSCGATVELDARTVEGWVNALGAQHAYTDVEHTVELFGLCPACSARA